jgi:hypothetical protein
VSGIDFPLLVKRCNGLVDVVIAHRGLQFLRLYAFDGFRATPSAACGISPGTKPARPAPMSGNGNTPDMMEV